MFIHFKQKRRLQARHAPRNQKSLRRLCQKNRTPSHFLPPCSLTGHSFSLSPLTQSNNIICAPNSFINYHLAALQAPTASHLRTSTHNTARAELDPHHTPPPLTPLHRLTFLYSLHPYDTFTPLSNTIIHSIHAPHTARRTGGAI